MSASSIFRWAGSKKRLLPYLRSYWQPQFKRYVEPFVGSACLYFDIGPEKALLSDINAELVATLKEIRCNPRELRRQTLKFKNDRNSFEEVRAVDPSKLPRQAMAARFLFLNRYSFNGLYRTNRRGIFNVPYSGQRVGQFPSEQRFVEASRLLQGARIFQSDFEELIWGQVTQNDFVYLDPPYAIAHMRGFSEYGVDTFCIDDLWRLRETLLEIERRGAYFLLSYADCPTANKLFARWKVRQVKTVRNIGGFASSRKQATELLFSNIQI